MKLPLLLLGIESCKEQENEVVTLTLGRYVEVQPEKKISEFSETTVNFNSLLVLPIWNTQRKHVSYFQQNSVVLCQWDNKHFAFIGVFLYQPFA